VLKDKDIQLKDLVLNATQKNSAFKVFFKIKITLLTNIREGQSRIKKDHQAEENMKQ